MSRANPLHIDIPPAPSHLLINRSNKSGGAATPGRFVSKEEEANSFFSLTRNGSQYPDSPSSDISSPMMTPLPFKTMSLLTPTLPVALEKDDRKKLREYEFPSAKAETPAYQTYQNHPFTQLQQLQQQQQPLPYSVKYANFTSSSNSSITEKHNQSAVVRLSPNSCHVSKDNSSTRKPSTTTALSMIEKEKMANQYPSHRISMVSPPPPPYTSSSSLALDLGAGAGEGTTTGTRTQSAAATIAIAPLPQVPDQELPHNPTKITTASLTNSKHHSLPVALARSASSSSSSSPVVAIAGSGVSSDSTMTATTPRVFNSIAPRDTKRHSLAIIPSTSTSSPSTNNAQWPSSMGTANMSKSKTSGHRSISIMPPQAIPIYNSTSSVTEPSMRTPPHVFNPRLSLSLMRLLERTSSSSSSIVDLETSPYNIKHAQTTEEGTDKDLSALIGPEHDHKNNLLSLTHSNIHNHNINASLSSPPRMQGLLRIASLQRATAAASAAERNLILSTSRIGGGPHVDGPTECTAFPGFWEDAKQRNMHWTIYSVSLVAITTVAWVFLMPALMLWAIFLPGTFFLLIGIQYSVYRWRRRRHYNQQPKDCRPSPAAVSSMRAASAALTHSRSSSAIATAPSSPQFHAFSPNHHHLTHHHSRGISSGGVTVSGYAATGSAIGFGHAHRSSLSSMHTSVGSIATSDSFLEPHQPSLPHHLKSQFAHHYYRTSGLSSVSGSPPRFSESYSDTSSSVPSFSPPSSGRQVGGSHQMTPSPEYRRSWFSSFRSPINSSDSKTGGNSGRWERTIQRRESSSSVASSETVSSSSTTSGIDSNESGKRSSASHATIQATGIFSSDSDSFSSIPMTSPPCVPFDTEKRKEGKLSSGDLSEIMMLPPPPAYISRRCEDIMEDVGTIQSMHDGVGEKRTPLLGMEIEPAVKLGLPEIAPLGDLMSEIAVDFGSIQY